MQLQELLETSKLCVSTGLTHPVCAELEPRFASEKGKNRLRAEVGAAYSLWNQQGRGVIARTRASVLLKLNDGVTNGLVTEGIFTGYWVHWIGAGSYFVARKNTVRELGPLPNLKPNELVDHTVWEFGMNTGKAHLFENMPALQDFCDIIE
jgi:hypothetical protein